MDGTLKTVTHPANCGEMMDSRPRHGSDRSPKMTSAACSDPGLLSSSLSMSALPLAGFSRVNASKFWKNEAQPHLVREAGVILEEFPNRYCYFASQWNSGDTSSPIVVLEKQH
jgi:hypothetical protein